MAYILPADLRADTLAEYAAQLAISDTEATTAQVTAAITRLSQEMDDATNDHYASETLTLDLTGSGTYLQILPKRCTGVTTVSIIDGAGTVTAQASTLYRLHSSLESTGSRRSESRYDALSLIQTTDGLSGLPVGWNNVHRWPAIRGSVRVVGTFGWTTTPASIKRAVALLVYDHFKPLRQDLRRASRMATADASYEFARTEPFGLPEVDEIVANYRRELYGMG